MKTLPFLIIILLFLSCKTTTEQTSNPNEIITKTPKPIKEKTEPIAKSINDIPIENDLKVFLKKVTQKFENHDWKGLQLICDPLNYSSQIDLGMGEAQFFAELFGLNYQNNSIAKDESITFEHLALVNKMKIHSAKKNGEINFVKGTVALTDKRILTIEFMVQKIGDQYFLVGASG